MATTNTLDTSFAAALKATRKGGTPANAISAAQAKAETDAAEVKLAGTFADAIKAIKAGMAADARKLKTLDAARDALLDVRCSIVRNTAHAMTFPESHAKAGKTAGKPSQSVISEALGMNRLTFAPYFKAAEEFHAKFPELQTEPGRAITDPEREHVASFWKSEALRAKARRDAKKAKPDTTGDDDTNDTNDDDTGTGAGAGAGAATDVRPSEVTPESVIAAMAVLSKGLQEMAKQGLGFSADQSELLSDALATAGVLVSELTVAQ